MECLGAVALCPNRKIVVGRIIVNTSGLMIRIPFFDFLAPGFYAGIKPRSIAAYKPECRITSIPRHEITAVTRVFSRVSCCTENCFSFPSEAMEYGLIYRDNFVIDQNCNQRIKVLKVFGLQLIQMTVGEIGKCAGLSGRDTALFWTLGITVWLERHEQRRVETFALPVFSVNLHFVGLCPEWN